MSKIAYHISFLLLIICKVGNLEAQQLRINEVASSNGSVLDEDGDSPDWFELYNSGENDLSLIGWSVSDRLDQPRKWIFSDIQIPANEYLLVFASGKDRSNIGVPRTLINWGDQFRYQVPTNALNPLWTRIGFDDTAWSLGNSGFGYGDNDDATLVPQGTSSVFIRKQFTISSAEAVSQLILDVDYDDGFIAYINGIEIARVNMSGDRPAFSDFANGGHDAMIYQNGLPDRFVIDNPADILTTGENVLCIQAHNINATSSDLTMIPFLSVFVSGSMQDGIAPPEILSLKPRLAHTNFKISTEHETLYLFNPTGALVDSIFTGNIPINLSLGYKADNVPFVLYRVPTPGAVNSGSSVEGALEANLIFSHPGGSASPMYLSISGASTGETIRYTTDATTPTAKSLVYQRSIPISSNKVVRARLFKDGYIPSITQSKTYIINKSHDLPVITLVTDPNYFFSNDSGIYVLGDTYDQKAPHFGANYWEDWERPIQFSLYEKGNSLGIEFNGGIKIFGGWSRANEQRSFAIFARNTYGTKEINYPLFPNLSYSTFQSIVLRNSGNDWRNTMLRDGALTSLLQNADIEVQAYRPTVTYINSEYWGIYNMREKINEHFLASKHNIPLEDIDILETTGEIVYGDNQEYLDLITFISTHDLSIEENYGYVSQKIDIDNLILYQVSQIYFDNTDWPGNNIKFWKAKGGKWRWILYDTDFGFGIWDANNYSKNTLQFALNANGPDWPNPPWSTLIIRKLLENEGFKNGFINQFADELNGRFLAANVIEHIDTLALAIESEIPAAFARWGGNVNGWNTQINGMKTFARLRASHVRDHIRNYFSLSRIKNITIKNTELTQGYVKVNSLMIKDTEWVGTYFSDVPITVLAVPSDGYAFSHWSGSSNSSTAKLELSLTGSKSLTPIFELRVSPARTIIINEVNYNSGTEKQTGDWIELYNPNTDYVDLSGWILSDNDSLHAFTIPQGTLMEPLGYLVLTMEQFKFFAVYPNMPNVIGDFSFGLSSFSDKVQLHNAQMQLQDAVTYYSVPPWIMEPNGSGHTLELKNPASDNQLAENWQAIHTYGSPGKTNMIETEIEKLSSVNHLSIFPNPFLDIVNVSFYLQTSSTIKITLLDSRGILVRTLFSGELGKGPHKIQEQLQYLCKGMYILQIRDEQNNTITKKWVKM